MMAIGLNLMMAMGMNPMMAMGMNPMAFNSMAMGMNMNPPGMGVPMNMQPSSMMNGDPPRTKRGHESDTESSASDSDSD